MPTEPFFDPAESCLDNLERGPFGIFAGTTPASQNMNEEQAHEL